MPTSGVAGRSTCDGFTGMFVVNISKSQQSGICGPLLVRGRNCRRCECGNIGAAHLTEWTATGTQPDGTETLNITNPRTPVASRLLANRSNTPTRRRVLFSPAALTLNTYPRPKLLIINATNAGSAPEWME